MKMIRDSRRRRLAGLVFAVAYSIGSQLHGAPYTWQGPGNRWSDPANWDPNTGPPRNAGDSATIATGPNVDLSDIDVTLDSLAATLQSPKSIGFGGHSVTVSTKANFSQGRLYLEDVTWDGGAYVDFCDQRTVRHTHGPRHN